MTAALKLQPPSEIAPPVPLGAHGLRLWRDTIAEFDDWLPHDLVLLTNACLAWQEVADVTDELADATDFKERRQLRADRGAAITAYRQTLRELALGARVPDSRPQRIAGRYA